MPCLPWESLAPPRGVDSVWAGGWARVARCSGVEGFCLRRSVEGDGDSCRSRDLKFTEVAENNQLDWKPDPSTVAVKPSCPHTLNPLKLSSSPPLSCPMALLPLLPPSLFLQEGIVASGLGCPAGSGLRALGFGFQGLRVQRSILSPFKGCQLRRFSSRSSVPPRWRALGLSLRWDLADSRAE